MPRQTRRSRTQPRRPHLRTEPLVLEPSDPQLPDGHYGDLESQASQLRERRFTAQPAAPVADNVFRRPSVAAQARQVTAQAARVATTDYGYVVGELKRIFGTAAVVVLLLIIVAVVHG